VCHGKGRLPCGECRDGAVDGTCPMCNGLAADPVCRICKGSGCRACQGKRRSDFGDLLVKSPVRDNRFKSVDSDGSVTGEWEAPVFTRDQLISKLSTPTTDSMTARNFQDRVLIGPRSGSQGSEAHTLYHVFKVDNDEFVLREEHYDALRSIAPY
jgi:hypothetical protein